MHGLGRDRRAVRVRRRHCQLDRARQRARRAAAAAPAARPFTFVQLSDSHIGFNKPPNADARATFREAIAKVKALPQQPDFIIHTGDVSQLSRDDEFDDADQMLKAAGPAGVLRPRRARHARSRRRQGVPRPLRQGHEGRRLVQLRPSRRAFRRAGQCRRPEARRHGQSRRRAARVAEGRPCRALIVDADRGLRAYPAVDGLCRLGLGHRRCRRGAEAARPVRLGDRAQRPHPPDHAEGRRADRLPHRALDRLPAARARARRRRPGRSRFRPSSFAHMLGITDAMFVRGHDRIALIDSTLSA